ncbi:helix-turn-helix transcriptional regulator [Chitinophaga sp. G-6-1-13]|uniref:Helix-turn-helix transcriptional regulator n=1 Tax=Chitinophaga fulva TaxID=2728842 RepID=A0A848GPU4_9BACT|nr:AraC family transcriptional regulator [Chitinophaga fulva]NML40635.1 helix-turn-helix transcriptional regulator [Chitinophaga fulva]
MNKTNSSIPYYREINDLLAALPLDNRTQHPDFYCLRLIKNAESVYKPPFRRGFYFIALMTNAANTKIEYVDTKVDNVKSMLVVQSPDLVYSFYRDSGTHGYIIYFKQTCFDYFKPSFQQEFPFFHPTQTDILTLTNEKHKTLVPYFEDVFTAYEHADNNSRRIASLKLLVLLYMLKDHMAFAQWQERMVTPQQLLLRKFTALVNNNYVEKRTVDEYAQLLHITPNHLSQVIKAASGKNALSHINERVVTEAKSLILYTKFTMAEIAYQLNFSDPANFGSFFKKQMGLTPLEFRENSHP